MFPGASSVVQCVIASVYQGSVTAFGAIQCLQVLLVLNAMVVEMCGLFGEASTISNPWTALMFLRFVYHGHSSRTGSSRGRYMVAHSSDSLVIDIHNILSVTLHEMPNGELKLGCIASPKPAETLADVIMRRHRAVQNWKTLTQKTICFHSNLMLHRQISILNCAIYDSLMYYLPATLTVGMSLIMVCIFFPIRFQPPIIVSLLCWTTASVVTGILVLLLPAAALVEHISHKFHRFWKVRLRASLHRKQLRTCRLVAIWIGPFCYFNQHTLLSTLNVVCTNLGALLINF